MTKSATTPATYERTFTLDEIIDALLSEIGRDLGMGTFEITWTLVGKGDGAGLCVRANPKELRRA